MLAPSRPVASALRLAVLGAGLLLCSAVDHLPPQVPRLPAPDLVQQPGQFARREPPAGGPALAPRPRRVPVWTRQLHEGTRTRVTDLENRLGPHSPDVGHGHSTLFRMHLKTQQYQEAEEHLRAALVIAAVSDGDPSVLGRYWAWYSQAYGTFPSEVRQRALLGWQTDLSELAGEFGAELRTLHYLYSLAGALALEKEQSFTARTWLENAARILRGTTKPNTGLTGFTLLGLGSAYERCLQPALALACFREAETILSEDRGATPEVRILLGQAQHNTGSTFQNQGKWDDADSQYRQALATWDAIPGLHPFLPANTLTEQALNFYKAGRLDEAEAALNKANRRLVGVAADGIRIRLRNIRSQILVHRGQYPEGEAQIRAALELLDRLGQGDSASAADARCRLAEALAAQRQFDAAIKEAERGLNRLVALYGPDDHRTAPARSIYAQTLLERQDVHAGYHQAIAAHRIFTLAFGEDHYTALAAGRIVAEALGQLGRRGEAIELLRRLIDPARRAYERDPKTLGVWLGTYAKWLGADGDPIAEPFYTEAIAAAGKSLDPHALSRIRFDYAGYLFQQARQTDEGRPAGERTRLFQRAASELDKLIRTTSNSGRTEVQQYHLFALYYRAGVHRWSGELVEAERVLRDVLAAVETGGAAGRLLALPARFEWGRVLLLQGKLQGAEQQFLLAAAEGDVVRPRFGPPSLFRLDPATFANPRSYLAAIQAKQQRPREAFLTLEAGLARNLTAALAERNPVASLPDPMALFEIDRIQSAIPEDAALVAWVDTPLDAVPSNALRFACILRREGEPVWVELPGSGVGGTWTVEDSRASRNYTEQLGHGPKGIAASEPGIPLADLRRTVYKLWVAPLRPRLAATARLPAVRRLIAVLPGPLAETPLETLTDEFVVSYCHSGSAHAMSVGRKPARTSALSVLAFGNPTYRSDVARPPVLPNKGVVVTRSSPALAEIRPGDVIQAYDGHGVATLIEFDVAGDAHAAGWQVPSPTSDRP